MQGIIRDLAKQRDLVNNHVEKYVTHRKEKDRLDYIKGVIIEDFKQGLIRGSDGKVRKMNPAGKFHISQLLVDAVAFDKYARQIALTPYFQHNAELEAQLGKYDLAETRKNISTAISYHLKHNNGKVDLGTLDGADFTRMVRVKRLSPGTRIYSAQIKGFAVGEIKQGGFYAPSRATDSGVVTDFPLSHAEQRGISPFAGTTEYSEYGPLVSEKSDTDYDGGGAEVLESTSAPIWDTWSSEIPILLEGRGIQYQIMGAEKEKVKTLERREVEEILTKIEQGKKTTLTDKEIDLLFRDIYVAKNKGEFAVSRGWKDSVDKEAQKIERVGAALVGLKSSDRLESLRDLQEQALDILRPSVAGQGLKH